MALVRGIVVMELITGFRRIRDVLLLPELADR